MVKIYFTLDNDGYLTGWGSTPSSVEGEFSTEVEDTHEVLSNPEIFKFVDGELIKDEERQQQLIKEYEEQQNRPSEIELLRQENEMLAMAVMELSTIVLNGGK